ncbi:MAG: DNA-binding response regulator [Blastocatellia bacterium]|nr:MAG: DNA-binding response regulator [Blastocatellia bacterium]
MTRPRVIIADDHKMVAQALAGLLEGEFDLVATVENGQRLLEETDRLKPDVVIVDISMPILNGFDAVRRLKQSGATAKVIFLTMHADARLVSEAFRCGASGYVLKQSAGEDLAFAIREVMAGRVYPAPSTALGPIEADLNTDRVHLNLTPRQREVLRLLSQGFTMKRIASRLGISTRTAESHKYEMMEALGVESTAELIQYAIKLGIAGT